MPAQALFAVSASEAEWEVVAAPYPVAGNLREAGPAVAQLQFPGIRLARDS